MKRFTAFVLSIVLLVSISIAAFAEEDDLKLNLNLNLDSVDLLEGLYQHLQAYYGESLKVRGYLEWGMSTEEVVSLLSEETHNGELMCSDVISVQVEQNPTVCAVYAKTILGDYRPMMLCNVSDLWGLYYVAYDIINKYSMDEEEYENWKTISDEEYLEQFEILEKTMNYVYGFGERIIDKWDNREEVQDKYFVIKTCWKKGMSYIYLECYRDNGSYYYQLEYQSPQYMEHRKLLDQDLTVTGIDMFYGF